LSPATVLAIRPQVNAFAEQASADTLVKLELALAMLQEVRNIQEAKHIHDVAKAARVYAREQRLGRDVILKARAVTCEALRRIGELLHQTDRAVGGRPAITPSESEGVLPTLAQLGLDYKTSSLAQRLFALPPDDFADVRDDRKTLDQVIARVKRDDDLRAQIDLIDQRSGPDAARLYVGSCAALFATGTIRPDAVVTKLPREALQAFSELALACRGVPLVAVRVSLSLNRRFEVVDQLRDHFTYPLEAMDRLLEHLTYRGGEIRDDILNLVFGREDAFERAKARTVDMRLTSTTVLSDEYAIQKLTDPGGLVCDPFLRAETAIAALEFGRRFVGCHVDAGVVDDTRRQIGAVR
jgi:hypothetical protein